MPCVGIGIGIPSNTPEGATLGTYIDTLVTACDAGVTVGDAVGYSAADHFSQANAASGSVQTAVGICVQKPTSTSCRVRIAGKVEGLSGLTAGAIHYLSAASPGALVTTPPSSSGDIVQAIGFAANTTDIWVDAGEAIVVA